jgi:hypothetical protein
MATINEGIGGSYKPYRKVVRKTTSVETLLNSKSSNSYISLGKDRPSSTFSGESGVGSDISDAIDIVAGPMGDGATEYLKDGTPVLNVNPHFGKDASRIYITQKGNIDDYFGLADGVQGEAGKRLGTSRQKSAIALKADHLRFISRESIKLVSSGTDDTDFKGGVYIIAENKEESLEPMVLGDKLVNYIDQNLVKTLSDTLQIIHDFMESQMEFNASIMSHTHISPFFGIQVPPSVELSASGIKGLSNQFASYINAIKASSNNEVANKFPLLPLSKGYILSKYHKLN